MFIELVDRLRCPNPHEQGWLVAAMDELDDRDIIRGTLGCPRCHAEFPIEDGVVRFADVELPPMDPPGDEMAIRIAATLELTDARMVAVLHGRWASYAPLVRSLSPARLILVNAPAEIPHQPGLSLVRGAISPVAPARVDALALDDRDGEVMRDTLVDALRPGGRIVTAVGMSLPDAIQELARDDEIRVGERRGAPPRLVPIVRGRA